MGLKNISKLAMNIQYNGIIIELAPDAVVDVRDFNINNHEVMAIEENLCDKYLDMDPESKTYRQKLLQRVKTLSNMTDAQVNAEIKRLEEVVEGLKADAAPREQEIADQAKMIGDMQGQLDAAQKYGEKLESLLDVVDPKWRKPKSGRNS